MPAIEMQHPTPRHDTQGMQAKLTRLRTQAAAGEDRLTMLTRQLREHEREICYFTRRLPLEQDEDMRHAMQQQLRHARQELARLRPEQAAQQRVVASSQRLLPKLRDHLHTITKESAV